MIDTKNIKTITKFIFDNSGDGKLSRSDINKVVNLNQGAIHYVAKRFFSKQRSDILY